MPGDEARAGADAHQHARCEAELERRIQQGEPVRGCDDGERGKPDAAGADPVDQPPAGDLDGEMGGEQPVVSSPTAARETP